MRRLLALSLLCAASPLLAGPTEAPPVRHVLEVALDPATSSLEATDTVSFPWRRTLDVKAHGGLEIAATCEDRTLRTTRGADGSLSLRVPPSCKDADGLATVEFTLKGRIADPVENEPSLHFVTGDRTSGIIGTEGAFLAGGTGWYAETGDLALYDVTVTVPAGWSAVSQGDAHAPEDAEDGRRRFRYSSSTPTDGLALSAGPYVVASVDHEGVRISTWLWEEDRELSPLFLDAAKAELSRLVGVLGPYPGTKFDIVENFFTTGYGFPTYTLLGRDVLKMGPRALRPGYLDHEIAHAWLGNHVSVDLAAGNWCEGLTSYLTNYLNTAKAGDAAALEARQRVSQRYSVDVPADKDFAPAAFREKTDDVGGSVGYGKVSMVFHLLERMLGEEAFRRGIRDFVSVNGGRRAAWADIESALEKSSGQDLSAFFAQWIGRAGLPELALENVRDEGGLVRGEIVQHGTPYSLPLEIEVRTVSGRVVTHPVDVSAARTPFEVKAGEVAQRVRLDAGFHVPRRIAPDDLPPSLARTLAGRPLLVVHGNPIAEGSSDQEIQRRDTLIELAKMAAGEDGRVMAAQDVAEIELKSGSVLLLGDVTENGWVRERAKIFDEAAGIDVSKPRSFRAGDRRWREGTASVLASAPNPHKPGATITVWAPNWYDAMDAGRMIFYYGWDTWAAIDGGRAQARGTAWPERSATSVVLAEPGEATTPAGRMLQTVDSLLEPRLEGRGAGTHAADAGRKLADGLKTVGAEPFGEGGGWTLPFWFDVRDLPGRPLFQYFAPGEEKARVVPVVPATEWLPSGQPSDVAGQLGVSASSARLPYVVRLPRGLVSAGGPKPSFEGLDLNGAAAVVVDDGAPDASKRIATWIEEARRRNAAALVVLRPDAEWPGEPSLVLAASLRDPAKATRLEAIEKEHGRRGLHRIATADRARLPALPGKPFPLYFAGRELADELKAAGGLARGKRTFADQRADLRLSFTLEAIEDWNVLGRVPGRSGADEPVVVLTAHHDGLGESADGTFQQGAADNAAGVAVVMEVARRLAADPPERPVVIGFLSGEEWGLQGSRQLVAKWGGDLPAVSSVLNVDSVGHAGKPLHVIGRSREPALAAIVDEAATAAGLTIGPDIDKFADRDGSDHWPWVAKGVPAIDLFQADYAVINTPRDTKEKLDPDTLERLADAVEASVRRMASGVN